MTTNTDAEPALYRENPSPHNASWLSPTAADATLEFGRFRVLLRQRQLVADGVPIKLGTRALDLLLVMLEADGSLVTSDELLSRVWPGIFVTEQNLKVQISALRKALGEDRDFIRTEFRRGYRFTAAVRWTFGWGACQRPVRQPQRSSQTLVAQWIHSLPSHGWCDRAHTGGHFDVDHKGGAPSCRD